MNEKLSVFPGVTFNYTQPAEDAVDEAETGLKSALDVKVFGPDLAVLEAKGRAIKRVLDRVRGMSRITVVQELGQPSLTLTIDRDRIARYGINVADVNGLIEAAVGGVAATSVVQGEKSFDLRRPAASPSSGRRRSRSATSSSPLRTASRSRSASSPTIQREQRRVVHLPRGQLALHRRAVLRGGAGPRGHRAGRAARGPRGRAPAAGVSRRSGAGSTRSTPRRAPSSRSCCRSRSRSSSCCCSRSTGTSSFPLITVVGVVLSAPVGGLLALALTGTPFSVSSGIGFLALFGVSVQTAVVYISYANELRQGGVGHRRGHARGGAASGCGRS